MSSQQDMRFQVPCVLLESVRLEDFQVQELHLESQRVKNVSFETTVSLSVKRANNHSYLIGLSRGFSELLCVKPGAWGIVRIYNKSKLFLLF